MAKENSEQREMIQEESPLSAELDGDLEAADEGSEPDLSGTINLEPALSTELDKDFEKEEPEPEAKEAEGTDEVEKEPEAETSESQLAAEVLKETEPTEEDGKVRAITALRASGRNKDEAIESLTRQLAAATTPKQEPVKTVPVESPIERYAKEQGVEDLNDPDFTPPWSVTRQQMDFEKQRDSQAQQAQTAKTKQDGFLQSCTDAGNDMTVEKMGVGLDFGSIWDMGQKLLRPGDEVNILAAGTGQAVYDECVAAIQQRGTAEQKELLASRLKAQNENTATTPKKEVVKTTTPAKQVASETEKSELSEQSGTVANKNLVAFVAD